MKVLIAKANEPIIKKLKRNVVFSRSTENTSTFEIAPKQFEDLKKHVKDNGYNPYALMVW